MRLQSNYPEGSRGAKRSKLRAAYSQLTDVQKEELRYAKEEYRLQLDLEICGVCQPPPTPPLFFRVLFVHI